MILFRVHLRVRSELRDPVLKSLRRLLGPTRAAKGCLGSGAYVDIEEDNVNVLYVEEWENELHLHARLRSASLNVLLSVMDLASEPPEIRFDTICSTKGMEVIAAARQEQPPADECTGS